MFRFSYIGIEPCCFIFFFQNHRHALMVLPDTLIRCCSYYGIAINLLACLLILPDIVQSREGKQGLIFKLKIMPVKRRTSFIDFIRLVKAGCWDKTAFVS